VEGKQLLSLKNSVNFGDNESLQYFQRTLKNSGVIDALERAGVREGDTVSIYGLEFDYVK
jgi:GTP-binding protein